MTDAQSQEPDASMGLPPGSFKLAAFTFCIFLSMAIVPPVLDPLVRQRFHLGNQETAEFLKVHSAAHLVFGILVGMWSDRLRRRVPLLVAGLFGSGIGTMLLPVVTDFQWILLLRFVEGIFSTMAVGLVFARAIDLSTARSRGRLMAMVSGAIPLAYLAASALAAISGGHLMLLFGFSGGLLLVAGFVASIDLTHGETISHHSPTVREILGFFRTPRIHLPLLFGFVDKFTFASIAILTAATLRDVMHRDSAHLAGAVLCAFWLGFLAAAWPARRLCEQRRILPVLAVTSAVYGIILILLGQAGLSGFVVLMAVAGVLTAMRFAPTMAWVGDLAGPANRATAMGAYNVCGTMGMIAGFAACGYLSDRSYALAWGAGGSLELLCALLAGAVLLQSGSRTKESPGDTMDAKSLVTRTTP